MSSPPCATRRHSQSPGSAHVLLARVPGEVSPLLTSKALAGHAARSRVSVLVARRTAGAGGMGVAIPAPPQGVRQVPERSCPSVLKKRRLSTEPVMTVDAEGAQRVCEHLGARPGRPSNERLRALLPAPPQDFGAVEDAPAPSSTEQLHVVWLDTGAAHRCAILTGAPQPGAHVLTALTLPPRTSHHPGRPRLWWTPPSICRLTKQPATQHWWRKTRTCAASWSACPRRTSSGSPTRSSTRIQASQARATPHAGLPLPRRLSGQRCATSSCGSLAVTSGASQTCCPWTASALLRRIRATGPPSTTACTPCHRTGTWSPC